MSSFCTAKWRQQAQIANAAGFAQAAFGIGR
jgi:hypothetical protein